MNAANYTYAFLAATALKQPFPAVSDTGVTMPELDQQMRQGITLTPAEGRKIAMIYLGMGAGLTVALGAIVYTIATMGRKKRRK
jgi:hypothetical protein